jgi:hypothetical protein
MALGAFLKCRVGELLLDFKAILAIRTPGLAADIFV